MPSPSLILSVALAASFVPLSNLSRSHSHRAKQSQEAPHPFADALANLSKLMDARLREDKIVPEVISDVPPLPVAVFYPYATVLMGNHIEPSALRHVPKFAFETKPGRRYSVLLLGPDYPTRSAPYERNHVLWFVTNYARDATHEQRPVCRVSYEQPRPPSDSGRARFVFLVYEQPANEDWSAKLMDAPSPRVNFMLDPYVSKNRLTLLAANYFVIDRTDKQESEPTDPSAEDFSGRVTDDDKGSDAAEGKGRHVDKTSETGKKKDSGSGTNNSGEEISSARQRHASEGKSNTDGNMASSGEKQVSMDKLKSNRKSISDSEKRHSEGNINAGETVTSNSENHAIVDKTSSSEKRASGGLRRDNTGMTSSEDENTSAIEKKAGVEKNSDEKKNAEEATAHGKTGDGKAQTGINEGAVDTAVRLADVVDKQGRTGERDSGSVRKFVETGKVKPTGTSRKETRERR
ncbi:protein rtoA-like [Dermacentor albipictus]|uniref:protein rtoA-like n=1 Tax=Dermacentor albipictus TaxID=60249 RepID=UPI0031FDEB48